MHRFSVLLVVMVVVALCAIPSYATTLSGTGWATSWNQTMGILSTSYAGQGQWYNVRLTDMGNNTTTICQGANATWNPNGDKIAYWAPQSGKFELRTRELNGNVSNTGVFSDDFQQSLSWGKDGNIYFTQVTNTFTYDLGIYNPLSGQASKLTQGGSTNSNLDPFWVGESSVGVWYADANTGLRFASIWNGSIWHDDLWIGKWQNTLRFPTANKEGRLFFSDGSYIYKWDGSSIERLNQGYRPVLGGPNGAYAYTTDTGWTTIPFTSVPEPGSLLALATGFAGFGGFILQKRK